MQRNVTVTDIYGIDLDWVDDYSDINADDGDDLVRICDDTPIKTLVKRILYKLGGSECYKELGVAFDGAPFQQEISSSVLFGDVMVRNKIFWTIREQTYFVYYHIISYRKIKVYRVKTIDMGRHHWNNGVSGTILLEQWCQWKMKTW